MEYGEESTECNFHLTRSVCTMYVFFEPTLTTHYHPIVRSSMNQCQQQQQQQPRRTEGTRNGVDMKKSTTLKQNTGKKDIYIYIYQFCFKMC